ncbi:U2 small nuclear ribonucleoprotein auxiliary factor-like protein [Rhynchospora pubera]|uniref:U2 small nuclear ribonucleoprotein auxiliary factor-like protein n=1 Tax=Rhynchospora pubera TaxID=906938 RepID=A0AAV8EQ24_9POAL|nr:U2 small nuclear ribonucleoprotein auxiliary factor-like protein [Rhynchospora pubera]
MKQNSNLHSLSLSNPDTDQYSMDLSGSTSSVLSLSLPSIIMPPKGFANFDPIFGEAKSELHEEPASSSSFRPILFQAYAIDLSRLRILASDFFSLSWGRLLTVSDLEDLRDDIGIGGSWSDFVDYLKSALSTGEVKIVSSDSDAKLVAFKSKGLPRITFPLEKLEGPAVSDANATFSVSLFQAYKNKQKDCLKEQERSSQLMGLLSSEREKNEILQKQIDSLSFLSKRKVSKPKIHDTSASTSIQLPTDTVNNSIPSQAQIVEPITVGTFCKKMLKVDGQSSCAIGRGKQPPKVTKRLAPVSRRARVRGVSLKSTAEDDEDN